MKIDNNIKNKSKGNYNGKGKETETGNPINLSRRNFVKLGGVILTGSSLHLPALDQNSEKSEAKHHIKTFRTLGRTGFQVSDISMGAGPLKEPNVACYAYDSGINYFDTAEGYGNGVSESALGKALKFMDRKKVFITTKFQFDENETEEKILERFNKCQERLSTEYIDALFIHGVKSVALLNHAGFHAATTKLKVDGKLKYIGVSNHGPDGEGESMEKVLCAAAEDGRFDVMLLVYSFMNDREGEKVLAACKKNNVGATIMKCTPGIIEVEAFDPDNLNAEQEEWVQGRLKRGWTRERAITRYQQWIDEQKQNKEKTIPFLKQYNITTEEHLFNTSIQWVLRNPDIHTICISIESFDQIDKAVSLSGTKLSALDRRFLNEYKNAFNNHYCRLGCNACVGVCPHKLPVSTIMRYAFYFQWQKREKLALQKYSRLAGGNAAHCNTCDAPCVAACPYHVDVQAHLSHAHSILSLG